MLLKCLGFCGLKNTSSSKKHYPMVIEELCHQFSLKDLRKSTNNFDEKLVIGRGGVGTVYKGCLEHNGATDYTIALKRMDWGYRKGFCEFKKEIELLCQLHHPNLVSLIGFCNHKDEKIIVYEYMNGSLHDYLNNRDVEPPSWKKRLEICIGAARGLHYLHTRAKRTIVHRDIRPSNILLDNNMVPKLQDFRVSVQGPLSTSKPKPIAVDSIEGIYAAPECVLHPTVTEKCDVYSFGMVLLVIVCTKDEQMFINKANMLENQHWGKSGSEYFQEFAYVPTCNIIFFLRQFPIEEIIDPALKGRIAPECWEVFRDIIERCLKYEQYERPTMGEVEMLLEYALSLQEEADIRKIDGDYTLSSATYIDREPGICIDDLEAEANTIGDYNL